MSGYYIGYAPLGPDVRVAEHQQNHVAKHRSYYELHKLRSIFEAAEYDPRFQAWKHYQIKHSQHGYCAWCNKKLAGHEIEIDHIQPLYYFGENEAENLVACHKKCNRKKGTARYGWNGLYIKSMKNKKPAWIRRNRYENGLKAALSDAKKQYSA